MDYFLFTYPNCNQCLNMKGLIEERELKVQEFSLVEKESKMKIREYLPQIKRDISGAVIIPTLVVQEGGRVEAVLNNRQELEDWLKLRA